MMKRRSHFQSFNKTCKCIMHEQWGCSTTAVKISSSKKFKTTVIHSLREKKLLPLRANFLCYGCYSKADNNKRQQSTPYQHPSSSPTCSSSQNVNNGDDEVTLLLRKLAKIIEEGDINSLYIGREIDWRHLVLVIGRMFSKEVYNDRLAVQGLYKQPTYLIDLDIKKYITERNQILVKFL